MSDKPMWAVRMHEVVAYTLSVTGDTIGDAIDAAHEAWERGDRGGDDEGEAVMVVVDSAEPTEEGTPA